jgi:hypothetical protein
MATILDLSPAVARRLSNLERNIDSESDVEAITSAARSDRPEKPRHQLADELTPEQQAVFREAELETRRLRRRKRGVVMRPLPPVPVVAREEVLRNVVPVDMEVQQEILWQHFETFPISDVRWTITDKEPPEETKPSIRELTATVGRRVGSGDHFRLFVPLVLRGMGIQRAAVTVGANPRNACHMARRITATTGKSLGDLRQIAIDKGLTTDESLLALVGTRRADWKPWWPQSTGAI